MSNIMGIYKVFFCSLNSICLMFFYDIRTQMIIYISFMFTNNQQHGRYIINKFRVKRLKRPLEEIISKKCKFENSSSLNKMRLLQNTMLITKGNFFLISRNEKVISFFCPQVEIPVHLIKKNNKTWI